MSLGFYNNCKSQNLIRNGSFENISPPASWGNWGGEFVTFSQTPSHRVLLDWDEFNSADLLTSACTHTYSGVPVNLFGFSQPKNGNNYVGFMTFGGSSTEVKEYIYQQLTTPLQSGKVYCLSYYISKSDRTTICTKNMDAYFTTNLPSTGSNGYLNGTPQVTNQNGIVLDTANWVQIQGCFTAIGGEQYIIIGNFNSNANTDTLLTATANPFPSNPPMAYYYIDDISLIDQTTVAITELNNNNKGIHVLPNPAKDMLQVNISGLISNCEIEIYDSLGQWVLNKTVTNNSIINIENLQNGIYYYRISVNGKSIKNDKIIIVK